MASTMPIQKNGQQVKITMYWLNKSRAQRVLWLLEELGLEYDLKTYKRGDDMLAPEELKDIHPLGKSPMIGIQTPDMAEPRIIIESGNIVEYVAEHFGKHLIPARYPEGKEGQVGAETEAYMRYKTYVHYAEGSMMPPLLVTLITHNIRNSPVPFLIKFITRGIADKIEGVFSKQLGGHFKYLESQIASSPDGGEFLCGKEISGADFMMVFPLEASEGRAGLTKEKYPKLSGYIAGLRQREAYQRAIKKVEEATGEPYDASLT